MNWQTAKSIILVGVIVLVSGILFYGALNKVEEEDLKIAEEKAAKENNLETEVAPAVTGPRKEATPEKAEFISPLSEPDKRIRLKRFGDFITPETSPVSPERFRGYHTGVDMEVFPDELNSAVEARAACAGKIIEKKWVNGYGGVVVTGCETEGEAVTALYGHLNLASISSSIGDIIMAGDMLGNLGADNSQETDKERKHLHFAIHKGDTVNLKGYVSTEAGLKDWLDPCEFICN
jgi:murein DD-endopeptidase MepM/ murein hydrolase activator NlpD